MMCPYSDMFLLVTCSYSWRVACAGGERAYFPRMYSLRDHMIEVIEHYSKDTELPIFMWGQSMGGLVTVMTAVAVPNLLTGMGK